MSSKEETIGVQSHIGKLKSSVWTTKGARFNAHRRLERRSTVALWTLGLLSMLVFVLSLTALVFADTISAGQIKMIGLSTAIISFVSIWAHVYEYSHKHDRQAFSFHKSGQKLSELYNRIALEEKLADDFDEAHLIEFSEAYAEIIKDFDDNHANCDFRYFLSSHKNYRDRFNSWQRFSAYVSYHFSPYGIVPIYLLIPIGLLIVSLLALNGLGSAAELLPSETTKS